MTTSTKESQILARQARRKGYYIAEKKKNERIRKAQTEYRRNKTKSTYKLNWKRNALDKKAKKM